MNDLQIKTASDLLGRLEKYDGGVTVEQRGSNLVVTAKDGESTYVYVVQEDGKWGGPMAESVIKN